MCVCFMRHGLAATADLICEDKKKDLLQNSTSRVNLTGESVRESTKMIPYTVEVLSTK